ncbi:DUF3253 domain-containing protein [Hoeflea sp. YIM 152468]|uniref:DUF3253 domain-containing protein n=1 Tax=Hoeflea sp. YIM 152468 TaxID=3031759 RepID=UPI0023DC9965|nr:DUF3253 domain-containing protein [Hoeflea sp. YIM 152468]MDF1609962.1 DUF3253 domain-containing protein [Hoeflea sp. YIM 152468]
MLRTVILELLAARAPGKSISPSEAARTLAGSDERQWSRLMKPLRAVAVEMAKAGELEMRRKNKVVDASSFRGVYRLALPASAPPVPVPADR